MFGHTIAVHLRAQLSHFELCMVFPQKLINVIVSKAQKWKGEEYIMTIIIPTISYFNLEGVCLKLFKGVLYFNSEMRRFSFTSF